MRNGPLMAHRCTGKSPWASQLRTHGSYRSEGGCWHSMLRALLDFSPVFGLPNTVLLVTGCLQWNPWTNEATQGISASSASQTLDAILGISSATSPAPVTSPARATSPAPAKSPSPVPSNASTKPPAAQLPTALSRPRRGPAGPASSRRRGGSAGRLSWSSLEGYCGCTCGAAATTGAAAGNTSCTCSDIQPNHYFCSDEAKWQKCGQGYMKPDSQVPEGYCQISCGRCQCAWVKQCDCSDTPPTPYYNCHQQAAWGQCGQAFMQGFCQISCGRCKF